MRTHRRPTSRSLLASCLFPLALAASLLGAGCSSDDASGDSGPACGNGKVESGEVCDGGDLGGALCTEAGFDGGELGCASDCSAIETTACEYYDVDADGLKTDAETAAGTDPNNPDTDGDGFTDGEEQAAGTNPLSLDSWPRTLQRWPNRLGALAAAGVSAEGWDVGDIARNVDLTDQYGNPLELHQLYGYKVVLAVGARWCGPCREAAAGSEELWLAHVEDGVVFVELLLDGNTPGVKADQDDITYWANKYELEFPVTFLTKSSSLVIKVTSLPSFFFIDREMRIQEFMEGYPGDSGIEHELNKLD
jgi:thiol-disulfide isomerase/thioredoxin